MKKFIIIGVLAVVGLVLCADQASAQFFRFGFGGFFRPRQNIQVNNFNGGGFNGNRFVNNGFRSFGGGNRVVVNNGFRGGFGGNRVFVNNGGYGFGGNRVFVNGGYGGYGFQQRVFVNNFAYAQPLYVQPAFVQPAYVNTFDSCGVGVSSFGYGGFGVRRFSCY